MKQELNKKTYIVTAVEQTEQLSTTQQGGQSMHMAEEKAVGVLCFLPKSIHRLASHAAVNRDITAKRFFLETMLIGLEQQGVITAEQRAEASRSPMSTDGKGASDITKNLFTRLN